jgi:Flp pilus assembly protein TadB
MTDDDPRYLDDDRDHRRGRILAFAATILLVVGAVVWLLGIPLWIVAAFVALVLLGITLST